MELKRPSKPTLIDETMTDEDWQEYFECRKKYDRQLSEKDLKDITLSLLSESGSQHKSENIYKFYVSPQVALSLKNVLGFKGIKNLNLYYAKKAFPDDF